MTRPDYSHFMILADRTSSTGLATDPGRTRAMDFTDGIRAFVRDQILGPGEVTFSLSEFMATHFMHERLDDLGGMHLDQVMWFADPDEAEAKLDSWRIVPQGSTPLIDAMATAIDQTGESLNRMPEDKRPERVYFIVATDGEENVSRRFTKAQLQEKISRQRDNYKWHFVFIGADIDAFAEAGGMGIAAASTMQTNTASSASLAAAYAGTSTAVTRNRRGPSGQSVSYSTDERKAANKKD